MGFIKTVEITDEKYEAYSHLHMELEMDILKLKEALDDPAELRKRAEMLIKSSKNLSEMAKIAGFL